MKPTVVEKMLPARLLTSIGVYLQTDAHLELALFHIIRLADGEPITRPIPFEQAKMKRSTTQIEKALRKSISKCEAKLGLRIAALLGNIKANREVRNLAAHGAFYINEVDERITAQHFFSKKENGVDQWYEVNESILDRQINEAIYHLDSLLREALEIREELQSNQNRSARP